MPGAAPAARRRTPGSGLALSPWPCRVVRTGSAVLQGFCGCASHLPAGWLPFAHEPHQHLPCPAARVCDRHVGGQPRLRETAVARWCGAVHERARGGVERARFCRRRAGPQVCRYVASTGAGKNCRGSVAGSRWPGGACAGVLPHGQGGGALVGGEFFCLCLAWQQRHAGGGHFARHHRARAGRAGAAPARCTGAAPAPGRAGPRVRPQRPGGCHLARHARPDGRGRHGRHL